MINNVIEYARNNHIKTIRLDALSSNLIAQKVYLSSGFKYCGKQHLYTANTGMTDFDFYELFLG